MSYSKIICLTLASTALLSFGSNAQANTRTSAVNGVNIQPDLSPRNNTLGHVADRFFGSSETATFYFKKGVNKLESGDLDKAAYAFRAALRADGTKKMDRFTLHYLAYINQQQGNEFAANRYSNAYINLQKR